MVWKRWYALLQIHILFTLVLRWSSQQTVAHSQMFPLAQAGQRTRQMATLWPKQRLRSLPRVPSGMLGYDQHLSEASQSWVRREGRPLQGQAEAHQVSKLPVTGLSLRAVSHDLGFPLIALATNCCSHLLLLAVMHLLHSWSAGEDWLQAVSLVRSLYYGSTCGGRVENAPRGTLEEMPPCCHILPCIAALCFGSVWRLGGVFSPPKAF